MASSSHPPFPPTNVPLRSTQSTESASSNFQKTIESLIVDALRERMSRKQSDVASSGQISSHFGFSLQHGMVLSWAMDRLVSRTSQELLQTLIHDVVQLYFRIHTSPSSQSSSITVGPGGNGTKWFARFVDVMRRANARKMEQQHSPPPPSPVVSSTPAVSLSRTSEADIHLITSNHCCEGDKSFQWDQMERLGADLLRMSWPEIPRIDLLSSLSHTCSRKALRKTKGGSKRKAVLISQDAENTIEVKNIVSGEATAMSNYAMLLGSVEWEACCSFIYG